MASSTRPSGTPSSGTGPSGTGPSSTASSGTRPPGTPPPSTAPAGTRPAGTRPIRLTLTALLVIPLVSLVALWGYAGFVTFGPAIQEHNYNTEYNVAGQPAFYLSVQLSQERLQTYIWLSSGRRAPRAQMDAQRKRTDAQVAAAQTGAASAQNVIYAPGKAALKSLLSQLDQMETIRNGIDAGKTSALGAFQAYSNVIDADFNYFEGSIAVPDTGLYRESAADLQGAYALELSGREAALVGGALASGGRMSRDARQLFDQTVNDQRYAIGQALARLSPEPGMRAIYAHVYSTPAYATFSAMENQILDTPHTGAFTTIPFTPAAFQQASQAFIGAFAAAVNTLSVQISGSGHQLGNRLLLRLILAGGVGLAAVVASIFLLIWFSRRTTRELTGLRDAARNLADERLPRIVERLSQGEDVDVAAESPPLATGKTAEIAAVAQAFGTVQRTAAQAAVGQAELRKGVSRVFLNLARRNQSLLHRQLSTLDVMERRTSEPEALGELFRLDHLTTRMRRYAESLIILSGNVAGRGWNTPVPAVDVLRAAVAEVEDYTRVNVACESRDAVAGAAVADSIHMLAELVENATSFSPPNTKVTVRGERVGRGFAVEIEDRGLGIDPENLRAINERLATQPEFDLAASDQLGLFVVAQLAGRHGIRVSLRSNPYGGTTAIVLLPHSVMATDSELSAGSGPGDGAATALPAGIGNAEGDKPAQPGAGSVPGEWGTGTGRISARHRTESGTGSPASWSPAISGSQSASPGWEHPGTAAAPPDVPGDGTPAVGPAPTVHPAGPPAGWSASPPASPAGPEPGAPSERPAPSAPAPDPGTYMGLPRRQRQASLAPQLRDSRPSAPGGTEPGEAGDAGRSPEEVRALMTSVQQGWRRGHADADRPSEVPPWAEDQSWPGQNGLRAPSDPACDWPAGAESAAVPDDAESGDE